MAGDGTVEAAAVVGVSGVCPLTNGHAAGRASGGEIGESSMLSGRTGCGRLSKL